MRWVSLSPLFPLSPDSFFLLAVTTTGRASHSGLPNVAEPPATCVPPHHPTHSEETIEQEGKGNERPEERTEGEVCPMRG